MLRERANTPVAVLPAEVPSDVWLAATARIADVSLCDSADAAVTEVVKATYTATASLADDYWAAPVPKDDFQNEVDRLADALDSFADPAVPAPRVVFWLAARVLPYGSRLVIGELAELYADLVEAAVQSTRRRCRPGSWSWQLVARAAVSAARKHLCSVPGPDAWAGWVLTEPVHAVLQQQFELVGADR